MKLISLKSSARREELLAMIKNCERVNDKVKFDGKKGSPSFFVKEGKKFLRIRCQFTDGSIRDNGFLEGTYFIGKITEKNDGSAVKGIVVTAPIYHAILAVLMALFVYRCISLGGFNPVPVIMLIFSLFMFKGEFEKQGVIERYLRRAARKADEERIHTDV